MVDQNVIFKPSLTVVVILVCDSVLDKTTEITNKQIVDHIIYNYMTTREIECSKHESDRLYNRVRRITNHLTKDGILKRDSRILENKVTQHYFTQVNKPLILVP